MNWPILLKLLPYNKNYNPEISNHYQLFGILLVFIEFNHNLKYLGKMTYDQICQYIYGYVFMPAQILPYACKTLE